MACLSFHSFIFSLIAVDLFHFPLGELNFRMECLILDDVNLFVVKGIKYRAMSCGIISGKLMHIIESVCRGVCWRKFWCTYQLILKIDRGDGFSALQIIEVLQGKVTTVLS